MHVHVYSRRRRRRNETPNNKHHDELETDMRIHTTNTTKWLPKYMHTSRTQGGGVFPIRGV